MSVVRIINETTEFLFEKLQLLLNYFFMLCKQLSYCKQHVNVERNLFL